MLLLTLQVPDTPWPCKWLLQVMLLPPTPPCKMRSFTCIFLDGLDLSFNPMFSHELKRWNWNSLGFNPIFTWNRIVGVSIGISILPSPMSSGGAIGIVGVCHFNWWNHWFGFCWWHRWLVLPFLLMMAWFLDTMFQSSSLLLHSTPA